MNLEEEDEQRCGMGWLMTVLFPTSRRSQKPESQLTVVSEVRAQSSPRNYKSQDALFSHKAPS